jgi:hypothetical protein
MALAERLPTREDAIFPSYECWGFGSLDVQEKGVCEDAFWETRDLPGRRC